MDGLSEDRLECKKKLYEYNNMHPEKQEEREKLLREILGRDFFANYNFIVLDVGKVKIGDHFMCGPNVQICTAGHPIHPESRNSGYEYGIDITIGENVWIGGNVLVCPGVTIGNNVVIGGGSVVTKDIPDNVVAVGNPCHVLREITEEDRDFYFKDRRFDVDDYK